MKYIKYWWYDRKTEEFYTEMIAVTHVGYLRNMLPKDCRYSLGGMCIRCSIDNIKELYIPMGVDAYEEYIHELAKKDVIEINAYAVFCYENNPAEDDINDLLKVAQLEENREIGACIHEESKPTFAERILNSIIES